MAGQGSGSGLLGRISSRTIAGAAAGNLTVAGIKFKDRLITVQAVSVPGANLVGEFTVTADNTINNTAGTSTAGVAAVLVEWESYSGGRQDVRQRADGGRSLS